MGISYPTTECHIPEVLNPQQHCFEKLVVLTLIFSAICLLHVVSSVDVCLKYTLKNHSYLDSNNSYVTVYFVFALCINKYLLFFFSAIGTSLIASQIPPELPPRSSSPGHSSPSVTLSHHHVSTSASSSVHGSVISSSWHGQQPQPASTLGSEPASNPTPVALGRSHSAVMASGSAVTHSFDTAAGTLGRSSGGHLSTTVAPPPNVSVTAVSSRPADKV